MSRYLSTPQAYSQLAKLAAGGTFVVVPAFDVVPPQPSFAKPLVRGQSVSMSAHAVLKQAVLRAQQAASFSKQQILDGQEEGWIWPFKHFKGYTAGHGATDYVK